MKKRSACLLVISLLIGTASWAQNSENRNYIFIGTHAIDYTGAAYIDQALKVQDWSIQFPISKVAYARYLNKSLAADATISLGLVSNARMGMGNQFFTNSGLGLRYKFTNGYLLKESSWFDPYVRAGVNYHYYDYSTGTGIHTQWDPTNPNYTGRGYSEITNRVTMEAGVGFNIWFSKRVGFNWETSFNKGTGPNGYQDFLQHSAGIVFRFGAQADRDKDGIPDKVDQCPDVPGFKIYDGCPDTDGDGVHDGIDKCPTVAGPKENDGCPWPDTDKDGVLDKDDQCPTVAGPKENAGCPWPDADKDGVPDKDDQCPTVAGPAENHGCPWPDTDGDGVLDKDDQCPTVAGTIANHGCPEVKTVIKEQDQANIDHQSRSIYFITGSSQLTSNSKMVLNKVAGIIKQYPQATFEIQGHTDNVGSDQVNRRISEARANTVKTYLVTKGVKNKLVAKGYGESQPIASNKTSLGRTKNRRVVIKSAQ